MKSFPWDSIATSMGEDGLPVYDRAYNAGDLREVYKTFFTNGVFLNEDNAFTVLADEGMNVIVSPGKCCINGTVGWEKVSRTIVLQSPSSLDRIDTVVLRWNADVEARTIDIYVKEGLPAEIPEEPTLTRNESLYELGIANVYVASNDESLSQQRITDTRLEDLRCGMVTPLLDIDTNTFYQQLQAQTNLAVELANAALAGTIPGQLQEQIDAINSDGWVTTERVADSAITTNKIANGAITADKLSQGLQDSTFEILHIGSWLVKKYANGYSEAFVKVPLTSYNGFVGNTQGYINVDIPEGVFAFVPVIGFSTANYYTGGRGYGMVNSSLYIYSTTQFAVLIDGKQTFTDILVSVCLIGKWK